jgi:hypothetical protein
MSRTPPGQNRKQMTAESGLALDSQDARYDVTQWRKDLRTKLYTSGGLKVGIVDADGTRVNIDAITQSMSVIDHRHSMIHAGQFFTCSGLTSISPSGTYTIHVVTPATPATVHLQYTLYSNNLVQLDLYEGATITGDGTPVLVYNRNRPIETVNLLDVYTGPTATDDGTVIETQYLSSGEVVACEFVLKPSTSYLLRMTEPTTSNTVFASFKLEWYEFADAPLTYVEVVDDEAIVFVDEFGVPFVMED